MKNIYDLAKSFEYNATYGPFGDFEVLSNDGANFEFLGQKVNSLFGVPACPLTAHSRFVSLMGGLGFDILTYKTCRSLEWPSLVAPNWSYVDVAGQLGVEDFTREIKAHEGIVDAQEPTMANSFGVASLRPDYWLEDFSVAKKKLSVGQMLILSVMPTSTESFNQLDDAEALAELAMESEADVVEVNLACPNTLDGHGLIYENLELSNEICHRMSKIMGSKKKLLAKVGYYKDKEVMKSFLQKNDGVLSGISSTNTYSMRIIGPNGEPEFFPGRASAGLSGAAIRTLSMEQAGDLVAMRKELGLKDFSIIGIGGVTEPQHVQAYLDLGVDAVQSAVGAFHDPMLAKKYKEGK